MLAALNKRLRRICGRLRWPIRRRRSKSKVVIQRFRQTSSKAHTNTKTESAAVHPHGQDQLNGSKPIHVATFNAAMFSMAPVVPNNFEYENKNFSRSRKSSSDHRPKGILKQSPLHASSMKNNDVSLSKQQLYAKSKLRVSINLPDNEISLLRSRQLSFREDHEEEKQSCESFSGKVGLRSTVRCFPEKIENGIGSESFRRCGKTVVQVLKEVDADILALQDVKAEEEKDMKPLSDLANALGMNYVFAESWAPEYGNAILSKYPIKQSNVQKIFDDTDFRNVLKATIDVPKIGEVNFQCTHLDHLDEDWRMKQINAIIRANDGPHILAGGLNSLEESDYSPERWTDIVKYHEEIGKPTPKLEVMRFLKGKRYTDAKDFAGECESVVMIAKGQNVQGTCKYGTRVDYILASPSSPYKFVPGSYSVFSSKGTSDHHIVKVDIIKEDNTHEDDVDKKHRQTKQKVVKITKYDDPQKGIWKIPS